MSKTFRVHQTLIIIVLVLLLAGVGCSLPRATAEATAVPAAALTTTVAAPQSQPTEERVVTDATATSTAVIPTATPAAIAPLTLDVQTAVKALQAQLIAVYNSTAPAVVNITTRTYAYDWFMQPIPQEGTGSGFVYDNEGHIVTNYHVVENAQELVVTLAGGGTYDAKIVGVDPTNDLAVLRIEAGKDLPNPLVLGDSAQLQVGQIVLAIGNPFGLQQTLTMGVISALGRVIQSPEDNRFIGEAIQTDAAINPGNSGGPLLDLEGRVIGVNSQIISTSGASAGIGFAIPVNTVRRVVPKLITQGYYPHPWLGVELLSLTPSTAKMLREAGMNLPVDNGLLVTNGVSGGPADKAGIKGSSRMARLGRYQVPLDGDVITAINGQAIKNFQDLTVYLETKTNIGDTVKLTILRDGQERVVEVQIGEQPRRV
ncbi:MAG: trypsin-like peptidase domain-containing protein [Chloroflexi bacterium]|nr:trypsin-like peptidase domain-containing protein [Chloroflexota bacterium]